MSDVLWSVHLFRLPHLGMLTTQAYAALLTLAQSAYDAYHPQWLRDDSHELIIANVAAAMGIAGCEATFEVRKCVAREIIEKERV